MISLSFRLDDPSPTSDHEIERRIIDVFAKRCIPLSVAVIPFREQGEERIGLGEITCSHLLDAHRAGIIEIAQHGYSHAARRQGTEFAGLEEHSQRGLIHEGQTLLAGLFGSPILGFVPPWNTFDAVTVKVLEGLGFAYLCAGAEVGSLRHGGFPVIPGTGTLKTVKKSLQEAVAYDSLSPVCVIAFHPYDFEGFRDPPGPGEPVPFTNLRALDALLEWIENRDDFEVRYLFDVANEVREGARLWRPHETFAYRLLPWRLRKFVPRKLAFRESRRRALLEMLTHRQRDGDIPNFP